MEVLPPLVERLEDVWNGDDVEVNPTEPDGIGRLFVNHLKQEAALGSSLHCFDLLEPNGSNELGLDLRSGG